MSQMITSATPMATPNFVKSVRGNFLYIFKYDIYLYPHPFSELV